MAAGAAAGAAAAGGVASSLIQARQAKKKRKQEAKLKQADIISSTGRAQSEAISGVIGNIRAILKG